MAQFTEEQLQVLYDAVAHGHRKVKFADREVEFRDIDQLLKAITIVKEQTSVSSGTERFSLGGFSRE